MAIKGSSEEHDTNVSEAKLFAKLVLLGNMCYPIQSEKENLCPPEGDGTVPMCQSLHSAF